jgi:hypothetical protein
MLIFNFLKSISCFLLHLSAACIMTKNKNSNSFYPVSALSFYGRLKILFVKIIFRILHLFVKKRWKNPRINFEENPIHFNLKDILYLGYKYYLKPHEKGKERFVSYPFKKSIKGQEKSCLSLHVGGDLMPYEMLLDGRSNNIWELAGDDFFGADIVMANLECPMDFKQNNGFVPEVMLNDMLFNGSEELMKVFSASDKYKFDVLTLANNHMLDAGYNGLKNTMNLLDNLGVKHTGARRNEKENNFLLIEEKGIVLGIVNYTYSLNRMVVEKDKEYLVNYLELNNPSIDITILIDLANETKAAGAEVLIAYLHLGNAYQCYPSEHVQNQVHRIIKLCCFDVVYISHPHNLQPGEIVPFICKYSAKKKNGIVYYSLGDFVSYDIFNWSHLTGYAKLILEKKGAEILLYPSFEFLYLQRNSMGILKFIPWSLALENQNYQDDQYSYLLEWYNKHAKYFFNDVTI